VSNDPNARPDLQILPSRALGNGSAAVCDKGPVPAPVGGVPSVAPPTFALTQYVADVLNDFACRFLLRASSGDACTGSGGLFAFVDRSTTRQFCGLIGSELAFPKGDTLITVRVLDQIEQPGQAKSIVIRVP
jgi:hypothetical protein